VHVPLQTAADAEVSWNDLQDVPAWLADDTVSLGDLDDLPAWLADGDVNWGDLQDLPAWLADGDVNWGDLQDLPAWLADGDVDWGDLQDVPAFLSDGAVSYDEIAGTQVTDSVTGDTVDDESLTGDDIDDGSLTGADLANGSVTPAQLDPEAASSSDGSLTTISGATTAAPAIPVAITADEPGQVAVSGQVQLTVSACAPCVAEMSYQLLRNDGTPDAPVLVPVSPIYHVQLSDTNGLEVASISIIDTVPAGRHGYQLFFVKTSGTGTVTTSAGVLNAQFLG
jgi:hypothetical protein